MNGQTFNQWLQASGLDHDVLDDRQKKTLKAAYILANGHERNDSEMSRFHKSACPVTDAAIAAAAARTADVDDNLIAFSADVELTAEAGDNAKRPSFSINAYGGGPMSLNGFSHPLTVDLAGTDTDTNTGHVPIFLDHDDAQLVGQGTAHISQSGIAINGTVTGDDGAAKHVVSHAKNGFKWQASIGGKITRRELVDTGRTVVVNGRQVTGPAIVARGFKLKEVSFVPLGADPTTSATIAAQQARASSMSQINVGTDGAATDATVLRERKRISEIRAMCQGHDAIASRAIDEGWDLDRAELEVLRAGRGKSELESLRAGRPNAPQSLAGGVDELYAKALPAAMLISSGLSESTVGKYYGENVMNLAVSHRLRGAGIQSAFRAVLAAAGKHADVANHRFDNDAIRASFEASGILQAAGFSTISLPGILGDYLNKFLLSAYEAIETTWQTFCAVRPLDDFLPQHIFRMVGIGEFQRVGQTGELNQIQLGEEDYTVQADTYGALIALTRQMIVNDSLSAFGEIAGAMGRMGVIKLEEAAYTLLLSNPATGGVNYFSSTNGNYGSGGGSALALSALAAAEKSFLLQVDNNGKPILLRPKTLLVGPSNIVTARQLIGSTDLLQTALQSASGAGLANQQPSGNPFVAALSPANSPWLENANIVGNSTTGWYLFGDPKIIAPFLAGFLNGQQRPTVQSGESSFSTLGMQFRSFFDFGIGIGDYRSGYKSAGA